MASANLWGRLRLTGKLREILLNLKLKKDLDNTWKRTSRYEYKYVNKSYHCSISRGSTDLIWSPLKIMKTTAKPRLYLMADIDNSTEI